MALRGWVALGGRAFTAALRRELCTVEGETLLQRCPPSTLSLWRIAEVTAKLTETSGEGEDVFGGFLKEAARKLDRSQPEAALQLLRTCSRLRYFQKEPISDFLQACDASGVFAQSTELRAYDVTALLSSLARLHKHTPHPRIAVRPIAHRILHGIRFPLRSMLMEGGLDQTQISKIIFALGVLQFRDRALMSPLLQFIESPVALRGLSPRNVASLVYGLSQLQITDFYSLQPLTHLILYEMGLEVFSDVDVASLLLSAVKMRWRNEDLDQQLAKEACLWRRLSQFNVKTFTSVCLSLGRLPTQNPAQIQRLVSYLKQPNRLEQLDSQGLANVALAMQLMGVSDQEFWNGLTTAAMRPSRLKCFTEQGIATLIHSLSGHVQERHIWEHLRSEILTKRQICAWRDASLMTLLMGMQHHSEICRPVIEALFVELTQPMRLQQLSEKNLIGAFVCLCRLEWQNLRFLKSMGRALLYEILHSAQRRDHSPRTIALTLYALGTLRSVRLASNQELIRLLQKALQPRTTAGFTSQGWAIMIFGLGELRFQEWDILEGLVAGVFRKGLSHFSTFELCDVFFGLGKCGYTDSKAMWGLLSEILKQEREQDMTSGVSTTLILAFAYHRLQDAALLQTVLERVLDPVKLSGFTKKQLSTILQSLAVLQCVPEGVVERIVPRMVPIGLNESWTEEGREQIPWLIHSLGKLKFRQNEIWSCLLEELRQQDYRLIVQMSPPALSSALFALKDLQTGAHDIRERLIERLLNQGYIENGSLLKAFEALVTTGDMEAAEKLLMKLLTRRRVKDLSGSAMARLAECLFQTQLLTESPYGNWFLTELLYFRDGLLFSRFSDAHLLYLITSLKQFIQQKYPYLPQLVEALKNEIYSIQRRDSIQMLQMLKAMAELKSVEAALPVM